ncbi:hypothetical protein LguiA_005665 [Lonicera macranthoides]
MRTAIQSESRVVVVVEECEFSLVGPETIPKEFFQKNTEDQWRSLILIIGDRLPCQVKSAILSTLTIMIRRGGINPFLPWLQTTFVKCLRDNTRMVHSSAALALGKLIAIFYPVCSPKPLQFSSFTMLHFSLNNCNKAEGHGFEPLPFLGILV